MTSAREQAERALLATAPKAPPAYHRNLCGCRHCAEWRKWLDRTREQRAAIATLVALHGPDQPDEWEPAHHDAAEAAAAVLAPLVRGEQK